MCKESGTATWNLVIGLLSNENITQSWRVSVPRGGPVAHTSPFMHNGENMLAMGTHLGAHQEWGYISISMLGNWRHRVTRNITPL